MTTATTYQDQRTPAKAGFFTSGGSMSEPKERPILFSGPMVRALLEGSKTQTRRALKEQPPEGCGKIEGPSMFAPTVFVRGEAQPGPEVFGAFSEDGEWSIKCPYGQPGDRLWVREAWWQAGKTVFQYPGDDEGGWGGSNRIKFSADGAPPNEPNLEYPDGLRNGAFSAAEPNRIWRKRPSIHMPRWACRILLEVVSVRVERLNDISNEDAIAEGLAAVSKDGKLVKYGIPDHDGLPGGCDAGWPWVDWKHTPRNAFCQIWESINGAGSWDANPWVWCVEFKRIDQQETAA